MPSRPAFKPRLPRPPGRTVASLAICMAVAGPALAAAPDITGTWATPAGATIKIAACGATPCGRLVGFPPPAGLNQSTTLDANNKDASKRGRKLLGLAVLWKLQPGDRHWQGRAYDPRRGFSVPATVTLPAPDRLTVKGCVTVVFQICETETWRKVK